MTTLSTVIIIIHSVICLALILLILLHAGKGGGMSATFGEILGPASSSSIVEKNLNRITVAASIIFAITTILLNIILW